MVLKKYIIKTIVAIKFYKIIIALIAHCIIFVVFDYKLCFYLKRRNYFSKMFRRFNTRF